MEPIDRYEERLYGRTEEEDLDCYLPGTPTPAFVARIEGYLDTWLR
ncbi:hypothetical protein ACFQGT_02115 [Natrialbaceae archaeon GCM10025810]